jgi:hypothetical protein
LRLVVDDSIGLAKRPLKKQGFKDALRPTKGLIRPFKGLSNVPPTLGGLKGSPNKQKSLRGH